MSPAERAKAVVEHFAASLPPASTADDSKPFDPFHGARFFSFMEPHRKLIVALEPSHMPLATPIHGQTS